MKAGPPFDEWRAARPRLIDVGLDGGWGRVALGGALVCALGLPTCPSRARPVPAPLRASILVRVLAFERTTMAHDGALTLAVVRASGARSPAVPGVREMARAFEALASRVTVAGHPLRVVTITARGAASALRRLRRVAPQAVYFTAGSEPLAAALAPALHAERRLTLCADGADVGGPCLVGVEQASGRSRVVVDLARARRFGFSFDARLLRLSRVLM